MKSMSMEEKPDNDTQKETTEDKLNNSPVLKPSPFTISNKKLLVVIVYLLLTSITYILERDIAVPLLLVVALIFFHFFLSVRLIIFRYTFLIISIGVFCFALYRFYHVLFPSDTLAQETSIKEIDNNKTDVILTINKDSIIKALNDSIKNVRPKTQKSNIVAKKENVSLNRAWVNINQCSFSDIDSGKIPFSTYTIMNTSDNIPASILEVKSNMKIGTDLYDADLDFIADTNNIVVVLSPNQESALQKISFHRKLNEIDIFLLVHKERFIFIIYRIIYRCTTQPYPDTTMFSAKYKWDGKETYIYGGEKFNFMH